MKTQSWTNIIFLLLLGKLSWRSFGWELNKAVCSASPHRMRLKLNRVWGCRQNILDQFYNIEILFLSYLYRYIFWKYCTLSFKLKLFVRQRPSHCVLFSLFHGNHPNFHSSRYAQKTLRVLVLDKIFRVSWMIKVCTPITF